MFTTMCALLAAGFESNVSAENWHSTARTPSRTDAAPARAGGRRREGVLQGARGSRLGSHALALHLVWVALRPAPKFQITLRRDDLPTEVLALEGFSEILSNYYSEQKIGRLWRDLQPIYSKEIEKVHDPVSQIVFVTTGYLRQLQDATTNRTFTVILEPLVGRITNVRNSGSTNSIVLSGSDDIPTDIVRHALFAFSARSASPAISARTCKRSASSTRRRLRRRGLRQT